MFKVITLLLIIPILMPPSIAVPDYYESGFIGVGYHNGDYYTSKLKHWDFKAQNDPNLVAIGNFTNTQQTLGWMTLEIKTDESFKDEIQAVAAGIAEGYLTHGYIKEYYKEFYGNESYNEEMNEYFHEIIRENLEWMNDMILAKRTNNNYWHHVNLLVRQMEGMTQGYELKSKSLNDEANDPHFHDIVNGYGIYKLNFLIEYFDFMEKKAQDNSTNMIKKLTPSCSVLVRILDDEIIYAHNTWHEYRALAFRLLKKYELNFHMNPNSDELIPGNKISMSSYAASMASMDDFYLMSSGLGSTETTLFVYNKELFRLLTPKSIMETVRVMIANRLATNTKEWSDLFSKYNSGTYNNQWMIMDFNKFRENPKANEEIFRVIEQLPGRIVSLDQTRKLQKDRYWGSFNRAYYPEIFELSGAPENVRKYGDWFSHDNYPRAKIMKRDAVNKVIDMDSMMKFMWNNDFENEEFAIVENCEGGPTPAGSMSNRLDLSYGNCTFSALDWMIGLKWGYGGLDTKIGSSKHSYPSLSFDTVLGPFHNSKYPPFSWTNTSITNIPEFTPIKTFNFTPFKMIWRNN